VAFAVAAVGLVAAASGAGVTRKSAAVRRGEVGPRVGITGNGRLLRPVGRLSTVGDFPSGAALSPDGRFLWAVDSGHGRDDVHVVDVRTGRVRQVLPLPGAYGGVAFAPSGRVAYVSGEPLGDSHPRGRTLGDGGDVVHVFALDPRSGRARERPPIALPTVSGGQAQSHAGSAIPGFPPPPGPTSGSALDWPEGVAVAPGGRRLVVALNQADRAAVVDLPSHRTRVVKTGAYPDGVAVERSGRYAFVSNEFDGTVSMIDLAAGSVRATFAAGGQNAHPEGLVADPRHPRVYVAVANRDEIAVLDWRRGTTRYVSLARRQGLGAAPVALALAPDGRTLYSADAGEDAIAAVSLTRRCRRAVAGRCRAGELPGLAAYRLIGRIPTAAYPTAVAVSRDARRLVWVAAKGLGAGPNRNYGEHFANSDVAPYGSYVPDKLLGRVGVLRRPSDRRLRALARSADRAVRPADLSRAPRGTPVLGARGAPSAQIKHVFYIVRENRTYDQVFGSQPGGDGDPRLELFADNGVAGPTGGVTPNAHRLARRFGLLDHFYADSEVSVDGHLITSGAYATDYVQRALHANYSNRGRVDEFGSYPVSFPPKDFLFDQAVRQGVSFRNYGELSAGVLPTADDGRPTYRPVQLGTMFSYPFLFGCDGTGVSPNGLNNAAICDTDSGTPGPVGDAGVTHSRFDFFQQQFRAQIATGTVPALNYLTLPNDHTNGVRTNYPTPKALVADNDLGLGQIVELISHSPIWPQSAIFVVEDDSQDGADHVDAHRMPAFVISPWTRPGAVVHTRYDQDSALRTMELILGLRPLSLFDGLAEPMYDAFTTTRGPDLAPYTAVQPQQSLTQSTTPAEAKAGGALARTLPYQQTDLVPQALFDRVLWRSVHGPGSTPPPPGPNASPAEENRARGALLVFRRGENLARWLRAHTRHGD